MAVQKSESTLLKKVWDIANVLSAAGVGFTDYVTQLTYILFLKMDEEKEDLGLTSTVPDGCKWKDLVHLSGNDLVEKYEEILQELSEQDGIMGTIFTRAANKIDRPVMLKKVMDMVNEENWYMMEGDVKGAIYEKILEASQALDDAEIPETERVLLVSPATYILMKKSPDIMMDTDIGQDMRLKGVIANIDGANVIKVPSVRLPSKFGFMLAHPSATLAPVKLENYRVHQDPPGISGSLVEGRVCYDAFVLDNKKMGIYYQATT